MMSLTMRQSMAIKIMIKMNTKHINLKRMMTMMSLTMRQSMAIKIMIKMNTKHINLKRMIDHDESDHETKYGYKDYDKDEYKTYQPEENDNHEESDYGDYSKEYYDHWISSDRHHGHH